MEDVQARISGFIDKYAPETAALTRDLLERMEARLPGAVVMVYDNYNALVFGYGSTERPSKAVLSLAVFPDHVTLCFIQGKGLPDPHRLLKGEGNQVRHIRLAGPETLDDPRVEAHGRGGGAVGAALRSRGAAAGDRPPGLGEAAAAALTRKLKPFA